MPVDPNGTYFEDEYEYLAADSVEKCKTIVEWHFSGSKISILLGGEWYNEHGCPIRFDQTYRRKKPKTTQTKPMEDEHETLCADSMENFKTIVEWMFTCGTQVKSELDEEYSHFNVSFLERGRTYRRKKPQPKKVKKLVPRTAEEFWPLIGRWWARNKDGERYLILNANWSDDPQEHYEIAPLGTEEWQPMMVFKEVEGEE